MTKEQKIGCLVLWDIENIAVPSGLRGEDVVRKLKRLVLNPNHGLPPSNEHLAHHKRTPSSHDETLRQRRYLKDIIAVCSIDRLNPGLRTQLQDSGVVMQDCASGKPSAADMAIMVELLKFTYYTKPPFRIYLISGDSDFAKIVHQLDHFGYEVVLIHQSRVPTVLLTAAAESYYWSDVMDASHGDGFHFIQSASRAPRALTYEVQQQQHKLQPRPGIEVIEITEKEEFTRQQPVKVVESEGPKSVEADRFLALLDAIHAVESYLGKTNKGAPTEEVQGILEEDYCRDLGFKDSRDYMYQALKKDVIQAFIDESGKTFIRIKKS
ncbi:hypothetical protein HDU97_003620 [Phlyctochytrium planicorne]|nr:hypothetical protein HDU97_003620 [Phlyctochytrium planicorne]